MPGKYNILKKRLNIIDNAPPPQKKNPTTEPS